MVVRVIETERLQTWAVNTNNNILYCKPSKR